MQRPGGESAGGGCVPMGTSRAGSGQLHGQLPKATGVRAVHSRPPPASTAACGVSAPFLGEGMVLAVQSPGPEACTPGGSLAGPHQAWTAQTPRRRPASLHPGKQTARYHWPVGFLAFTGGALEWRLPGSAQRVVAPPQKVPPAEQAWGEVGAGTGVVWDAVRWPAGGEQPAPSWVHIRPPASVCLPVKWGRAHPSRETAGLAGTGARRLACTRCSQTPAAARLHDQGSRRSTQ